MATKKETIKQYRQEIADLTDHNLSAELYDRFNAEEDFTEKEKQTLHVELSTKVNELKQALHDEADAKGDAKAAAAAIAPEPPFKGSKGEDLRKPLMATDDERLTNRKAKPIHVPEGCKAKEITAAELSEINQDPKKAAKLVGIRPVNPPSKVDKEGNPTKIEKYIAIMKVGVLALFVMFGAIAAPIQAMAAVSSSDEAVLGNSRWRVNSDGNFVPATTNTYGIGTTTDYPSQICLAGSCVTSFATVISPWTDNGTTLTANGAPTKFVATYSSGNFKATQLEAGTGDILLENAQSVDGGTNNAIKFIENSDTLTLSFPGTTIQLDSSDGGFQFALTDATEGEVDFLTNNDTDDYMLVKTVSDVPTIATLGTSNLAIVPDGGTTAITGALTVSTTGTFTTGLTSSSTLTLQNSETIANATNGTIRLATNTSDAIAEVYTPGTTDQDATIQLTADAAGDNGDTWQVQSDGATNGLLFRNNTSGSQATIMTLANTGLLTLTSHVTLANNETIKNSTDDTVEIASEDSNTILRVYSPNTSDGTASITLVGDAGADATDSFKIANGAAGSLLFQNDSSVAGTFVTKLTMTSAGALTTADDITIDGTTPQLVIGNATGQGTPIIFEGATADAFETSLLVADPTADINITIPATAASAGVMLTSLTTNQADAANAFTVTSNGIIFVGATADAFETTLSPVDPTADQTVSIANAGVNNALMFNTLTTNTIDAANSVWFASNSMVLEGATADAFELTLAPADVTADETATIPNFAVNFSLLGSTLTTNTVDAANSVWGISNALVFEGATADAFETTLSPADPTADETLTIPATAGAAGTLQAQGATVVITAGTTPTLTVPLAVNFIATDTITTDNQDQTITFSSGGSVGQTCTIVFQTDSGGSNDEVITFQTTLANTTGTLTLANLTANRYVMRFQSDGTVWNEVSRTGAQT